MAQQRQQQQQPASGSAPPTQAPAAGQLPAPGGPAKRPAAPPAEGPVLRSQPSGQLPAATARPDAAGSASSVPPGAAGGGLQLRPVPSPLPVRPGVAQPVRPGMLLPQDWADGVLWVPPRQAGDPGGHDPTRSWGWTCFVARLHRAKWSSCLKLQQTCCPVQVRHSPQGRDLSCPSSQAGPALPARPWQQLLLQQQHLDRGLGTGRQLQVGGCHETRGCQRAQPALRKPTLLSQTAAMPLAELSLQFHCLAAA